MGKWAGIFVLLMSLMCAGPVLAESNDSGAPDHKPFSWLVGHRSLPADQSPGTDWSEPTRSTPSVKRAVPAPRPFSKLELSIEERGDILEGTLAAIAPDESRRSVATFTIDRGQATCPLVWREAGARYEASIDAGSVARNDQQQHLRYSHLRGPRHRRPYPIVIELFVEPGALILRRVQGPQHGAAIDHLFRFR